MTSSAQNSPTNHVNLHPPDCKRYLVWGGNPDQLIQQDFREYSGDSVEQIISTFKGVSVDGVMHDFM